MKDFNYWRKLHDGEELKEFNHDSEGLLWLKLKSITRSKEKFLDDFASNNAIILSEKKIDNKFRELFNILKQDVENSLVKINEFISVKHHQVIKEFNSEYLVEELYKVDTFKWGADNQNDLGKFLIKKYVKDNSSYDFLISKIDNEISRTVQDYLVSSWYNHWCDVLIEHVFKSHEIVQPTVGKIKYVDFFINNVPFDLKVTSLPVNFIEKQRKIAGLVPELTYLKQGAKNVGIKFSAKDTNLYYQLSERLKDKNTEEALKVLEDIRDFRLQLIDKVKHDPKLLAKNLYEEQSDFRFGAENRLFLIIVDKSDFTSSWKLRRNLDLLRPSINEYLNSFNQKSLDDLTLFFHKKGDANKFPKRYEVLTDVILVEN